MLQAASLQWDADGVAPLGDTGTWDTSNTLRWFNGLTYQNWVNANNDDAVFDTTAGTVTLGEPITANSLTFNITGYTLAGGGNTLTLGSGNATVTTTAHTANVNAALGGTSGLTKLGAGILTVGTAGSYTGNTLVSTGVLAVGASSAFNTAGLLTVNSGATFRMSTASANQEFTGVDGAGTIQWTVGSTNNPRLTLNVASGTTTFSGTLSSNQAGNQRVASITKAGGGTQLLSNGTAFAFDRTLLTLTGGTLQVSANNQMGYLQISGNGGTLQLDGKNQSIDTWAANSTVNNSSVTTSTLSSPFNNKDWSGNITGNIRIRNGGSFDTNLRGTNSFTGGVELNPGAFTITAAGQFPANQIDFSGGSLDFSAANLTLASDRTYTVASGGGSFRYRVSSTGSVSLQGAINNSGTPGTLNFVTHPSNTGASTFNLSGGGNFSGTTTIGGSSSAASVTLRPGAASGISSNTVINFGGGNTRTYSLDLNGFSQQVAGLQNTGTGTSLVQRVITSSAAVSQVLTVNNALNYTFSGKLGDTGTNNNNFGLTKNGVGTFTLSGTHTYTGETKVDGGVLALDTAYLDDASTVRIASGASVLLTHAGEDVVESLVLGNTPQPDGLYTASTPGGFIAAGSTGSIRVITQGSSTPYEDFVAVIPDVNQRDPQDDPDADGLSNLLEFVLGGNPNVSSQSILPTQVIDANNIVLSYKRTDASELAPATTSVGQYSTDLVNWVNVTPVLVNENGGDADDMTVTVAKSNDVNGKLFVRVKAVK